MSKNAKLKQTIVKDWLTRYTDVALQDFNEYILLTNFHQYLDMFCEMEKCEYRGKGKPMQVANSKNGVSIINFGIGSPNAALIIDLLAAITPKAVLFLGKCGGIKSNVKLGDLVLPIAAIRGEGTSDDYFDPRVPALPSFKLQKAVSHTIAVYGRDYYTGTIYTTNRRVWEHDDSFKKKLKEMRVIGIDMETATIFTVAFANKIPHGALLLVSDNPMQEEGIKTSKSDKIVNQNYVFDHLKIGIESLKEIKNSGQSMKHLKFY